VRDAKAQLAAMQAKIDKIAAGLDKGTHAHTAGQRHLAEVQRTARSIRRQLDQLRAASVQGQLRLNQIANAAYRNPLPSSLTAAMAGGTRDFTRTLVAASDLEHVAGSQQDVLREVVAARVRTENLSRQAAS